MYYPYVITRQLQRYEYVAIKGYVTNKTVFDVGCGNMIGTGILAAKAKKVFGFDPCLKPFEGMAVVLPSFTSATADKIITAAVCIEELLEQLRADVCVCMEVFEHIAANKLDGFVAKLAIHGEYLFLSTPLVKQTHKTRNPDHVAEYSLADVRNQLEKYFTIIETVFQLGDGNIVDQPVYNEADSFSPNHVVQMIWARRRAEHGPERLQHVSS